MRRIVGSKYEDIIEYGCNAHQLNLLAKDLYQKKLVNKIIGVAKLFQNCHLPCFWQQETGCNEPRLPSDVRWNSCLKTLKWYKNNWAKLSENHHSDLSGSQWNDRHKVVKNIVVYKNVEDAITYLGPISEALDKIQSDQATTASAVETWKDLPNKFREMGSNGREWLKKCETRYAAAVPASFFASTILHPEYLGRTDKI